MCVPVVVSPERKEGVVSQQASMGDHGLFTGSRLEGLLTEKDQEIEQLQTQVAQLQFQVDVKDNGLKALRSSMYREVVRVNSVHLLLALHSSSQSCIFPVDFLRNL